MLCFLKNIFAKKSAKNWRFRLKTKLNLIKMIVRLVFEKNAIFSPKIVGNSRKL
jgi:hypothetical protein